LSFFDQASGEILVLRRELTFIFIKRFESGGGA
jgi:hypothetical protein